MNPTGAIPMTPTYSRLPVRSNHRQLIAIALLLGAVHCSTAFGQDSEPSLFDSVQWTEGPGVANLGGIAEVKLPVGYRMAGASDARRLLEAMENPTDGSELGMLFSDNSDWFVTFEFDNSGYIKDDEGADLDADAILKSIRAGNNEGNKLRKSRGWATLNITGWAQAPRYDSKTNNLVWAINAESEGELVVNYNTRRLGRSGVMNIALVCDPSILAPSISEFESLMQGFEFTEGNRYAEFKTGDKIAEYGLTALMTGGAAAVAVKSGAIKWLWKAIVGGIAAISIAFKKIFGRGGD